jgi:fatty acid desaturase
MPNIMNASLSRADPVAALRASPDGATKSRIADDMAMIRAAADLTRDLNAAKPMIYWSDFLASAAIGYGALFLAIDAASTGGLIAWGLLAILALYRAGSFIHELTHIKHRDVPGFRFAWNAVVGVPLMMPSFLYEGVHNLHHARTRYGTAEDPEYLPLALMKPYKIGIFLLVALLAPLVVLIRFGVIAPLSALIPPLRRKVVESMSALSINPDFRRRPADGDIRRLWLVSETAASLWAGALIIAVASGLVPFRAFAIFACIMSGAVFLNQIRTLVAHRWENDGEVMTQTGQYLDSVNVPPPALLPALWAPVGLRYHAIHHLLPGLPYHALGEAHRRLAGALPKDSSYHRANYPGLPGLAMGLLTSSFNGSR